MSPDRVDLFDECVKSCFTLLGDTCMYIYLSLKPTWKCFKSYKFCLCNFDSHNNDKSQISHSDSPKHPEDDSWMSGLLQVKHSMT